MLSKCLLPSAIKKLLSFPTILDHFRTNVYPLTKGIYLYNIHCVFIVFISILMEIVSCQTLCICYISRILNSLHESLIQSDLTRSLQKNEAFIRNLNLKFFQGPKIMEDFQMMPLPGGEESQQISTFLSKPTDHTTRIKSKQEIQIKHLSPPKNFMSSLFKKLIKLFKNLELCCNWQFHIQHQCTLIRHVSIIQQRSIFIST